MQKMRSPHAPLTPANAAEYFTAKQLAMVYLKMIWGLRLGNAGGDRPPPLRGPATADCQSSAQPPNAETTGGGLFGNARRRRGGIPATAATLGRASLPASIPPLRTGSDHSANSRELRPRTTRKGLANVYRGRHGNQPNEKPTLARQKQDHNSANTKPATRTQLATTEKTPKITEVRTLRTTQLITRGTKKMARRPIYTNVLRKIAQAKAVRRKLAAKPTSDEVKRVFGTARLAAFEENTTLLRTRHVNARNLQRRYDAELITRRTWETQTKRLLRLLRSIIQMLHLDDPVAPSRYGFDVGNGTGGNNGGGNNNPPPPTPPPPPPPTPPPPPPTPPPPNTIEYEFLASPVNDINTGQTTGIQVQIVAPPGHNQWTQFQSATLTFLQQMNIAKVEEIITPNTNPFIQTYATDMLQSGALTLLLVINAPTNYNRPPQQQQILINLEPQTPPPPPAPPAGPPQDPQIWNAPQSITQYTTFFVDVVNYHHIMSGQGWNPQTDRIHLQVLWDGIPVFATNRIPHTHTTGIEIQGSEMYNNGFHTIKVWIARTIPGGPTLTSAEVTHDFEIPI